MLGFVSYTTGNRPSSLFNWDEPDDWCERLIFDQLVLGQTVPKLMAAQQMGGLGGGTQPTEY